MIAKQKEVIARARDPGLNPDERRKAGHDVVLNMMGQPTFHDIDSALAEASEMPPEEAAEVRKAAMECAHDALHDSRRFWKDSDSCDERTSGTYFSSASGTEKSALTGIAPAGRCPWSQSSGGACHPPLFQTPTASSRRAAS